MRRILIAALAALSVGACAKSAQPARQANDADTMTRRQKDSVISTMPIPGARGVSAAQKAVDKINANTARLDSIR